jgi:uncharacterized protein
MTTLKFNVAQLLREEIGARRDHQFAEPSLPLDENLTLRDLAGTVRFTRTATGVYVLVKVSGLVHLTCVRSLEEFDYQVDLSFNDQIHSMIDVVSGASLPKPAEDDPFMLDELHMADVGELIREYTLIELPLNPVAEAYRDQLVHYSVQSDGLDETDELIDGSSLEALKAWAEQHNRKNR